MTKELFKCERKKCNLGFTAYVDKDEAPPCPKCKDSEYVTLVFNGEVDQRNPGFDDYSSS